MLRTWVSRGGVFVNVALALATFAALLLLAEGVARWVWQPPRPAKLPPQPEAWNDLPRLQGIFEIVGPNLRGLFRGVLFETNSHGFRGPERTRIKPRGVFRIAITGDSIAMGSGVLQEDTYAARLERALNESRSDHRFEVLNVSLGGANAHTVVQRFLKRALPLDPDLLVYGYTLNDIEGPHYRKSLEFKYIDPNAFRRSPSYFMRILGPRWYSLVELLLAPRGTYGFELDDNYFHNEPAWGDVLEALDRLAKTARQRRICAVLLVHTRLYSLNLLHPYRRHYTQIARAAEQRGFRAIQSYPYFMGNEARHFWVNPLDAHPNAEGHERLLRALLEGLESLPATCWTGRQAR